MKPRKRAPGPTNPTPVDPSIDGAPRAVLAGATVALAAAVVAASLHPGPRNWGLHAAGYLDPPLRNALLAGIILASGLVVYGLFITRRGRATPASRTAGTRGWKRHWPWILVLAWLALGMSHPVEEALLGDAAILIQDVQAPTLNMGSEPLSARLLGAVADRLGAGGTAINQASLGIVSKVAALPAGILFACIALEIGGTAAWGSPLALLLTLGASQYYFGYVESYPIALLFVLLYLWLGLRAARGAVPPMVAGVALAFAGAAHVVTLLLYPSYVYLLYREPGPLWRRGLLLLLPAALLATAFALLGFAPENLVHPFRVATQAAGGSDTHEVFLRPYPFFSWAHANDVANAGWLAAPVALLLLVVGGLALVRRGPTAPSAGVLFLAFAAVGGMAAVGVLMTPVAPAQDWDLFAFLLVPAAVLGIAAAGSGLPGLFRGPVAVGLAGLSVCLLLAFVLINADSRASISRFATITGDTERISPFGRAYASEILWILHRGRGQREQALTFARAALAAEPSNPRHSINVGYSLLAFRRAEEAIPYFQHAAKAAPGRWDAPFNLGLCQSSLGRQEEALAAFAEATRRDANRPEVWHAMVRSLASSGRKDSALVIWDHVVKEWPEYVQAERIKALGR